MYPRTAVIVFSLHKHCFVCIPASWKVDVERDDLVSLDLHHEFTIDWCYDHEFVIASPIDYDHGCAPIGWRDH